MADKSKDGNKKKGGGGRTTALAGLLAVVAVIAAWLSNCIPGFGIGADGSADGEPSEQAEPATPEAEAKPEPSKEGEADKQDSDGPGEEAGSPGEDPAVAAAPSGPVQITIDARGCFTQASAEGASAEPQDCTKLCESGELGEAPKITIDPTDAPHAAVTAFLDCLKTKYPEVEVAVTRDE